VTPASEVLAIGVGGAVGAVARYGTTLAMARWLGPAFPWGTLAVNGLGSFVLGAVVALGELDRAGPTTRALLGTGFCGAFTTFSTFSVETLRMPPLLAATNVAGNLTVSLLAAAAGFGLVAALRGGGPGG
jgi:fluoride exporter